MLNGDRPAPLQWIGLAVAFSALAYLVSPGLVAPHPLGTLLMVVAGLCWAAYTLIGRASQSPLADTAGNFIRCTPVALALIVAGALTHGITPLAAIYAVVSGAVASGLGYAVWYAALRGLSRTRAGIVQLSVPAIAAAGGVVLLSEPLGLRLGIATAGIIGGVALALIASSRRARLPGAS